MGLAGQRNTAIKVVASVSGPLEVRQNQELASMCTLEISIRPQNGVPGTFEKELGSRMHRLLQQTLFLNTLPRTLVQIVLQAQGNAETQRHRLVACYLNAISAALLSAGSTAMRGVFCAVLISRQSGGDLVVNCDSEDHSEDHDEVGTLGFLFSNECKDGELVWSDWDGQLNRANITDVIVAGRAGAREVYESFRNQIA